MRSARSNTVTQWPARFSWSAAARPAGPEPTTATRLPVRTSGGRARDPAFVERALDNRDLDRLDRDRVVVDAEHARALARRRAEPSRELGKVVRRVQAIDRRVPAIAIDEIVPVGNQVAERAPLVTERDAAVHAPRRLAFEHGLRVRQVDLLPVVDPLRHRPRRMLLALNFDEPCRFAHINSGTTKLGRSRAVLDAASIRPCVQSLSHVLRGLRARDQLGEFGRPSFGRRLLLRREHALVVARHHLDEQPRRRWSNRPGCAPRPGWRCDAGAA